MSLSLIAAIAQNNCIGINNGLPWNLPEDLKHFKQITSGKTVLMGRNTWLSLPEKFRPLPGRLNIVISYDAIPNLPAGVLLYNNLDEALQKHKNDDVFVIGGGLMYKQTIDRADKLYITHVHRVVNGDIFFPEIDLGKWTETKREDFKEFSFVEYERINN